MEMIERTLLEKFLLLPTGNENESRLFILSDEMFTGISFVRNGEQNQLTFAVVVKDKAARVRVRKTMTSPIGVFESWDTGEATVCIYMQNISPLFGYRHRAENLEKLLREGIQAVHSYAGFDVKEDLT